MTESQLPEAAADQAVSDVAAALGAADLFVFRRVSDGRFVHVGGVGRGKGWAGVVELALDEESDVQRAVSDDSPVWLRSPEARRVVGPYYARGAVIVPVDHDIIVVFGSPDPAFGDPQPGDATLRRCAAAAAIAIDQVSPAKRLADELEVLHAVTALTRHCPSSVDDVLRHIAAAAAATLSCELGLVYLPPGDRSAIVERGWTLGEHAESAVQVLRDLWRDVDDLPRCLQDAHTFPLPAPLDPASGVRSYYLVPLGRPAIGLLALLHTDAAPRGFTLLCQQLGLRLTEAAEPLVRTALMREDLEVRIARIDRDARTDALTGLANRLAWEEAIRLQQERPGAPVSAIVVDLNGLKAANDTLGHEVGDRLIRGLAGVVRDSVRDRDLVARVGGDEIAVLLPNTDEQVCARVVERLQAALATAPAVEGLRLTAAVGAASSPPAPSLTAALKAADRSMYDHKAAQRARPTRPAVLPSRSGTERAGGRGHRREVEDE